jgi:hypothetical protein
MKDTALYRIPTWLYNRSIGRFLNKTPNAEEPEDEGDDDTEAELEAEVDKSSQETEGYEMLEKVRTVASNGNGKTVKRKKSARGR